MIPGSMMKLIYVLRCRKAINTRLNPSCPLQRSTNRCCNNISPWLKAGLPFFSRYLYYWSLHETNRQLDIPPAVFAFLDDFWGPPFPSFRSTFAPFKYSEKPCSLLSRSCCFLSLTFNFFNILRKQKNIYKTSWLVVSNSAGNEVWSNEGVLQSINLLAANNRG